MDVRSQTSHPLLQVHLLVQVQQNVVVVRGAQIALVILHIFQMAMVAAVKIWMVTVTVAQQGSL